MLLLVATVLCAEARAAAAQASQPATEPAADRKRLQEHPTEPDWFLEPSYFAFVSRNERPNGAPGHIVEVQSMNHLAVFPRRNSYRYDDWIDRSRSRNKFVLTLGTVVRGHSGGSVPIQTPSIHFAGRWQRLVHQRGPTASKIWMYGAGIGHHSNGQDGCTFENQIRSGTSCVPQESRSAAPLNTKDGSFGVNYLELRSAVSSRTIQRSLDVGTALTLGADYRYHFASKIVPGGSGLRQIDHLYGVHEFRGLLQQEWPTPRLWRFDHVQLSLRGFLRFGHGSELASGGSADLSSLGFAGGTAGPFVRLYSGNDYYNIRFLEKRRFVMVGVVWDHARLARFPVGLSATPSTTAHPPGLR